MDKLNSTANICKILEEQDLPLHGFCSFSAIANELLPCRAGTRLKSAFASIWPPRTVIVVLFPYKFPDGTSNLSRYARVPDYHITAGAILKKVAEQLHKAFPSSLFLTFIDNSPIPEVKAASLAGLGCIGNHGLLIHPVFGSWVFIGTITTDLAITLPTQTLSYCPNCGACSQACPGNCINESKKSRQRKTCLSHITQKKGTLTLEEQLLIRKSGMAWGCDRCQEVCPLNAHAKIDPHPCFKVNYTPMLTKDAIKDLTNKAYGWRGQTVLKRNLSLIDADDK